MWVMCKLQTKKGMEMLVDTEKDHLPLLRESK